MRRSVVGLVLMLTLTSSPASAQADMDELLRFADAMTNSGVPAAFEAMGENVFDPDAYQQLRDAIDAEQAALLLVDVDPCWNEIFLQRWTALSLTEVALDLFSDSEISAATIVLRASADMMQIDDPDTLLAGCLPG